MTKFLRVSFQEKKNSRLRRASWFRAETSLQTNGGQARNDTLRFLRAAAVLTIIALCMATIVFGQDDTQPSLLKQVIKQNQAAVDAIAMYPPDTRKDIFEASMYPELIVQLSTMQKNTDTTFQALIAPFDQADQEKFYNITRYPDLISQLVNPPGQPKNDEEIDQIVANYPDEIRPTARDEAKQNYNLLSVIDRWNKQYDSLFQSMLADYPPEAGT
ncbi:MAG TPA: hypothetical protein VKS81_04190, partial [Bacteroidota bacterium]|nr:hypothetical protein [Bacteroidota bacterium]